MRPAVIPSGDGRPRTAWKSWTACENVMKVVKTTASDAHPRVYTFGPFCLDTQERVLLRDGVPVPLLPKSFDALIVLARNSGKLLSKEFLLEQIWPDTHVEENNLAHAISDIRRALGDGAKAPRYVVTVPRAGYRFAVTVDPSDAASGDSSPVFARIPDTNVAPPDTLPRRPIYAFVIGAAAVALVVAVGLMLRAWHRPTTPRLTDKDVLVLGEFANNTGEPVFDQTLREALAVRLAESPFLSVMDDGRIRQTLRLMGRRTDQPVTNETAREICIREREKAMIHGSIAALGSSYAILVQATACESGETIARVQVEARNKADVLRAVGAATTTIRTSLGESLSSIGQLERHPVTEVTTPSLDAFQMYARGADLYRRGFAADAIPFFQRATELDPDFAMAFHLLGNAYETTGEETLAIACSKQAFARRDRVSERERLAITAVYHMRVTGDAANALDAVNQFVNAYPRAPTPRAYRGTFEGSIGQFENAAREFEELVRLDPRSSIGLMDLMEAYLRLGRFDEALGVWKKAAAQGLDGPGFRQILLERALIQDDKEEAAKQVKWFTGRDDEFLSLDVQATDAIVRGERRKAAELLARAAAGARLANMHEAAELLTEASRGDPFGECQVRDNLVASLRACADASVALRDAEAQSRKRPADTILNAVRIPLGRAALALDGKHPEDAIELLKSAALFEEAYPEVAYVRGQAYLRARNAAAATAEFRKVTDHKGVAWGPLYPLAYLGLARAAVQAGDNQAARTAYDALLTLWADADPDLPIVSAARKERAAVHE
jgi:DNA-binding winged helix-turn-helix (wHTH) protein/Flp pilus assembly protein TadD